MANLLLRTIIAIPLVLMLVLVYIASDPFSGPLAYGATATGDGVTTAERGVVLALGMLVTFIVGYILGDRRE